MYDPTLSSSDCPEPDSSLGYKNGCPYTSFVPYWNYYCASSSSSCHGSADYANQIVTAAFEGGSTGTDNFAMNFSAVPGSYMSLKQQIIKKGTAYMNTWMYAIREFEDAIDDCLVGDLAANAASSGPVHAWDEGVAFYVGSLLTPNYLYPPDSYTISGQGKLAYTLANKRCINFKTCGPAGGEITGEAKVNSDLSIAFRRGQEEILIGNCAGVIPFKDEIVSLMSVPLVQGTLRYSYKCDKDATCDAKAVGEMAIFAAAILPRVHACSPQKAALIATMTNPSAFTCTSEGSCTSTVTDFDVVKASFEHCYSDMGITCADVGGLWDEVLGQYMSVNGDASPCGEPSPPPAATS